MKDKLYTKKYKTTTHLPNGITMQQICVGYVHRCKTTTPIPCVWLGQVFRVIHYENVA